MIGLCPLLQGRCAEEDPARLHTAQPAHGDGGTDLIRTAIPVGRSTPARLIDERPSHDHSWDLTRIHEGARIP